MSTKKKRVPATREDPKKAKKGETRMERVKWENPDKEALEEGGRQKRPPEVED